MSNREDTNRGQALVEFALIAVVLLLLIFFIIESARIFWGYVTVQHAAREGARYAVTGQFNGPECDVQNLPKFNNPDRNNACRNSEDLRAASVISRTHQALAGLPLNEDSFTYEDDNYYDILVWGVDQNGERRGTDMTFPQGPDPYAGAPNQTVTVRAVYRVPVVTPLLRPFLKSVPVVGQVTMNNESFGQLGNVSQSQGIPPGLPAIPTAGPTPTFTPTPTDTPVATAGPTVTRTIEPGTPTSTLTPTAEAESCPVRFEGNAIAGNNFVFVTGDIGTQVEILDLTAGTTLGIDTLQDRDGHLCAGFADYSPPDSLNRALEGGHVLVAQSSDGSSDTTIVIGGTSTPTTTATPTMTVSPTPTGTATPTPTNTPTSPFIELLPTCGQGPDVQFQVIGINWPANEEVTLFWQGVEENREPAGHGGFFQQTWLKNDLTDGSYTVAAQSPTGSYSATFDVPCPLPPNSTPTPTPTSTPAPPDLVVGAPELLTNPPLISSRPIDFRVVISNTGTIPVDELFFVDVYIDPSSVSSVRIPVEQSAGYTAVSGLSGGESREVIIRAPNGFAPLPSTQQVYSMVDSLEQIIEADEANNVAGPLTVDGVTPGPTPIWTPEYPDESNNGISGVVRVLLRDWVPVQRVEVKLFDPDRGRVVATAVTDQNGFYEFRGLFINDYTITTCVTVDNISFSGIRTGVVAPSTFADIFMLPGPCVR